MEERKKKRQDEKKEAAQKKAAEQKTKVPESAKPGPSPLLPSSPCSVSGGGNGKRAPSSALQQQPTAARHPPREVPPRFRQHEHKQLLKRGQPLPAGTQPLAPAAGRPHAELPHLSGPGAQYENPHWGKSSTNRSAANSSGSWERVIIDESDAEAWPSISRGDERSPAGCATDTERNPGKNRSMSMAAEGSQQGHYPAHHSGSKASGSHLGTMVASQGGASRGWGSGPAPCPSAIGGEVKSDTLPVGGRGQPCWGSSNSNLNLNPNANPSAWPVLGHEGPGMGGGLGGNNPPPPNLCSPSGAPPAHGSSVGCGNMGSINGNPAGSGGTSAWGGMMPSEASEPRPSPSTNVSFSGQPQNLNTDGPNHTKPEPVSPIHGLPSWGNASVGMGSLVQPHQGALQVNGEGSSVWGIDDAKDPKDPGWGCGGNGGGWGQVAGGDWGRRSGEAKGWEAMGSPPQEQLGSWPHAANNPASEGSSDSQEGRPRRTERPPLEEAAPPLPAPDLDPRVLCNTGWGQTPVRQHTAWEIEEASRARRKNDAGTEAWGSSPNPAASMAGGANPNPNPTAFQKPDSDGKNEGPGPSKSSGWVDPAVGKKASNGPSGWGGAPPGPSANASKSVQSWAPEEKSPTWDDPNAKPKPQNWVEGPKPTNSWGNGGKAAGGDWAEPGEGKKNRDAGDGGTWKESPRGWGRTGMGPGSGGGWGEPQPSGQSQGWGGKAQEGTNGNGEGGSVGSWGGPNTVKQSSSGWGMGPGGNGGAAKPEPAREPTGWEEPSPPSIRRKMEIDDGTSAWGDPSAYNKTVNLWDKNNPGAQGPPAASHGGGNHSHHHHSHHNQPPAPSHSHPGHGNCNSASPDMPGAPRNRPPLVAPGWGELPSVHSKAEPSWGEPASPSPMVDNGTSAWGKPPGGCGGWGGGPEPTEPFSRGNPPTGPAPCNPAPKSMQDGWGGAGDDLSLSAAQWEPEDGDVWNSTTSQESNSSCNSWGNPPKKGPQKGKAPSKQDDAWIMGRLVKQLTDMGFPRDLAEEALKSNNMNLDQAMSTLLEKKTELDKRGMGISDYNNGLVNKQMGCRPPVLSKESSSDRPPFLDKDGSLVEDAQTSPFMPSPSLRLPLSSSALPGQALGGMSTGLAMQNLNSRQQIQSGLFGGAAQARAMQQQQAPPPQPSVPPLSSSQPSLRAQVPQFLSPQVQAQLLQFAAKNIGLNPALLTSPINPQHMTLLNQLYQLQLAYQRLQIQQQMIQAQRGVSGPIRQQEQQVARTINNMQQQIQQHQRQLAQALLMKQNPTSHHNAGKSALDSFSPHLQTKEPQSSPNSYSSYPLSGLNHNMNVNSMDVGGLSMKESPQPQSRLSQWTHPNAMESLSGNSSPLEPSLGKHGASLGPPGKPSLDDSYSPYNLITGSESPSSPLVPPDSWGPSKSGSDKISNGTSISWPPEFCPGVPWKGLQNIDPETDPNVTPGSVPSGPTINTNIQDVNRYLLRDRSGGSSPTAAQNGAVPPSSDWPVSSFTSSFGLSSPDADDAGKISDKSAWSPAPISHTQASLSHELWKGSLGPRNATAPTRPPPGLTNTKPSSTWGGGTLGLAPGWNSSYSPGSTWSTDSSTRTSWLVLRNLTPQIDGSTLRTLCLQHGPLITFHLSLTQGNAVVRYSSKEEAAKAQKSLHMCVLGNTTILAEFAGEEEVNRFFAQGQSLPPTTCWQANPGTNQTRLGGAAGAAASHAMGHWNSGGLSGTKAGADLLWGGVPQYSSLWGPPGGEDARVIGSPTPINTLLPGDLLSGESL